MLIWLTVINQSLFTMPQMMQLSLFQRAAGACHLLYPVTPLHFGVRQARITFCTQWLAYIAACMTADADIWAKIEHIIRFSVDAFFLQKISAIIRGIIFENRFRVSGLLPCHRSTLGLKLVDRRPTHRICKSVTKHRRVSEILCAMTRNYL